MPFNIYEVMTKTPIAGVGGSKAHTIGCGYVHLKLECDRYTSILALQVVLHVPDNHNNPLSLGRWEMARQSYSAYNSKLYLLMKEGKHIVKGARACNELYK